MAPRIDSSTARALSRLLDEWDPIGVYAFEGPPPPGEYEDLVAPLLSLLA